MWDADMDAAPGWPACILQTYNRPHSGHVSQLMLENPNSMIGFQPIGNFLAVQILAERARVANQTGDSRDLRNPTSDGGNPSW